MKSVAGSYRLFVGADIAATTFAASWTTAGTPSQRAVTFAQTPDGFVAFQERLRTLGVPEAETLIVIEATGSYWVALAVSCHKAGFAVAVVNPAHVHNYARTLPRRAKTDALDAQLLAQIAAERQPPRWSPPPQVYHELRQRLVARDGLLSMRQQARNQRHCAPPVADRDRLGS
jgi:transposase